MRLGDILVARGLVTAAQVEEAVERQKTQGGRLGENLVGMGLVTAEDLEAVNRDTPPSPRSVEDMGVSRAVLMGLVLKFMHVRKLETPRDLGEALKLPPTVVRALLDDVGQQGLVETLGSAGGAGLGQENRYALTSRGRDEANDALDRNQYMGPAPVSLFQYQEQVLRQRITNEVTDATALEKCFEGMLIPDWLLRKIGPAINAGRSILLYGPPGNGKTSIATRLGDVFKHIVYIPYAIEVEGQIIKVFDEAIHQLPFSEEEREALERAGTGIRREQFDQRWVPCRRPMVVVGGELTLEMLDLAYSDDAKFYEAPLHMKAINGTMIIDDFGRQLVSPEALLNRWIVPMESRIDFLKMHNGKTFQIPFDEMIVFSTNMEPGDLMDGAFLRRIPYKIGLDEPPVDDFRHVFKAVARGAGLELADDAFDFVVDHVKKGGHLLAYYQPKFIVDQVVAACKYEGTTPVLDKGKLLDALENLYVQQTGKEEG